MLFRELLPDESRKFRKWARDNYTPLMPINELWHPIVRAECQKINDEAEKSLTSEHAS